MRIAIYVPRARADRWEPDEGSISFSELQKRLVNIVGGITLTHAIGFWTGNGGYVQEPVFIVEALLHRPPLGREDGYEAVWNLLRTYAAQLIRQGEESVLIVQDNEPTLITA